MLPRGCGRAACALRPRMPPQAASLLRRRYCALLLPATLSFVVDFGARLLQEEKRALRGAAATDLAARGYCCRACCCRWPRMALQESAHAMLRRWRQKIKRVAAMPPLFRVYAACLCSEGYAMSASRREGGAIGAIQSRASLFFFFFRAAPVATPAPASCARLPRDVVLRKICCCASALSHVFRRPRSSRRPRVTCLIARSHGQHCNGSSRYITSLSYFISLPVIIFYYLMYHKSMRHAFILACVCSHHALRCIIILRPRTTGSLSTGKISEAARRHHFISI